jgi:Ca2+-transporting ATPase
MNNNNGNNHKNLFYQDTIEEIFKILNSRKEGLTDNEIKQRLGFYGKNKLIEINKEPLILKFLAQFKDLMSVILMIAGGINIYLEEYRGAIILFVIVFINALISFFQEYKAERLMNSLKSLVETKAKVIRNGKEIEIDGEEIVPGDIVVLEEGDAVAADIRLFTENNLGANDFSLTGESNPIKKFTHPIPGEVEMAARNNLVYMGTTVATGNGIGVVIATGMNTEVGRIANLSQQTVAESSPLQKELDNLAKKITAITFTVGILLFLMAMFLKFPLKEAFIFAVGIAASCVPQGLPAQVSVALSLAAGRLAAKRAVVKKLSSVETLGSTHIICTDKTGTLTTNEMTVQKILIGERVFEVTEIGYEPKGKILDEEGKALDKNQLKNFSIFFETSVFASNAHISPPDDTHPKWYSIGDPTESALITLAGKAGVDVAALDKKYPEVLEFTFDAVRKRMSSFRKRDGKMMVYVKGAPLSVLSCCTQIWDGQNVRPITDADREFIEKKSDEYAMMALRNLGYAYRKVPDYDEDMPMEKAESKLIWLGQVSMMDPPRKEVKAAITAALKAYIRVIIITGDYALTAEAIAKKIGLNTGCKDKKITVVTGDELRKLTDFDLLHKLINTNLIFARTSPEDKLRIVDLLKRAGEIVAVTGDGVNDAPALKKADIGVAMGKTGTEVAKDSSDLILLDDSFATLVSAIKEGRTIFQNLRNTITSTLSSNGGELFAVLISLFFTSIFHWPLAITAVQILAIDLVGEMLPLTFLTSDPAHENIMTTPARNPKAHFITPSILFNIAWCGLLMGVFGYINFMALVSREGVSAANLANLAPDNLIYLRATTLTYITIVFCQWMNILSRRAGEESVFSRYIWTNRNLLISYAVTFFFILNIVYNPFITPYLQTGPLSVIDWTYAVIAAITYLLIREFVKLMARRKAQFAKPTFPTI